jgi:hypothetical protein
LEEEMRFFILGLPHTVSSKVFNAVIVKNKNTDTIKQ